MLQAYGKSELPSYSLTDYKSCTDFRSPCVIMKESKFYESRGQVKKKKDTFYCDA